MLPPQRLPNTIKIIAFDLGGVIFENGPEPKTYQRLSNEFKIEEAIIADALTTNFEIFHQGRINEDVFWEPLVSRYKIPLILCKEYYRESIKVIPEGFNYLKGIYQYYDCYTLNNEPKEWMDYRIKKFDLDKYFKGFITSSYFGVTKPDPKIYNIFLNTVKVEPKQILFIDNDKENLRGAKKLGFETFHYQSPQFN